MKFAIKTSWRIKKTILEIMVLNSCLNKTLINSFLTSAYHQWWCPINRRVFLDLWKSSYFSSVFFSPCFLFLPQLDFPPIQKAPFWQFISILKKNFLLISQGKIKHCSGKRSWVSSHCTWGIPYAHANHIPFLVNFLHCCFH